MTGQRPWLAGLLALVYPGLGHVYLRRWGRALVWFGVIVVAAVVVLPTGAFEEIGIIPDPASLQAMAETIQADASTISLIAVSSVIVVSVVDAYVIAREGQETSNNEEEEGPPCPECGKPLDEDLGFCHWCTTRLNNDKSEQ